MPKKRLELEGLRFGRLKVVQSSYVKGRNVWLCRCDCGQSLLVYTHNLTGNHTKSCGCLHKELLLKRITKHGMHGTREYNSWQSMWARCTNEKLRCYKDYGGRRIKVCESWESFDVFFSDMGIRPKRTTLDRINNDGNYEPSNCRWATPIEQVHNRVRQPSLFFKLQGESYGNLLYM